MPASHDADPPVTVLGSGVALGVFVPAVLVAQRLRALGRASEVAVFEHLYTDEAQEGLKRHRRAYHTNFDLACMTHRFPHDVRPALDPNRVGNLLGRWAAENRRHFIVWSGFWMTLLEAYRVQSGQELVVDVCRIDARISTSFRSSAEVSFPTREVWLWNAHKQRLVHEVHVCDQPWLGFDQREPRLIAHGGGWGIGTYGEVVPQLEAHGYGMDVVAYENREAEPQAPGRAYYAVDPSWSPIYGDGDGFPPFGQLRDPPHFEKGGDHHALLDLVRRRQAIVSKPGGGTLMDSLAAATPVVLLEPYGEAERANADVWEHLGFGIRFERWKEQGFPTATLEALHRNLMERAVPDLIYPDCYWSPLGSGPV